MKKIRVLSLVMLIIFASLSPSFAGKNEFTEKRVWIKAGDHEIPGLLVMPKLETGDKVPAVLMLHGWVSDKNEVGNMYRDLAYKLGKNKIASLRIDFAGSGDSKQEYFLNNHRQSVADGQKALNYLLANESIDHTNIGVIGFSQGGAIGQAVVAREPQVKAFATWSTARGNGEPDESQEAKKAKEKGFVMVDSFKGKLKQSREFYLERENARGLDEIARNYRGALLSIAGEEDDVVDPEVSRELVNLVKSNDKTLKILRGGDHIFNVLSEDRSLANETIDITVNWFLNIFK